MTTMRAPGSTVERMVRNGMGLLNIEVETDWAVDEIKALAMEIGFGLNAASGRFQRVAKPKPTPIGIVRNTLVKEAAAVAPDVETQAVDAECDVTDRITGRLCARPLGHDGNHQDRSGNRAWPQTDDGAGVSPQVAAAGSPSAQPAEGESPAPSSDLVAPVAPVQVLTPPAPVPTATEATPTVVEADAPMPPPASTTVTDPAALIAAGIASDDDDIAFQALNIQADLEELAAALVEYARRDALAEVARLEQLLAEARRAAGLDQDEASPPMMAPASAARRAPGAKPPVGVSYADLKRFSDEHGLGWSGRGRPTNALVEAYRSRRVAS